MDIYVQLNAASHASCKALQISGTPSFLYVDTATWSIIKQQLRALYRTPYHDTGAVGEQDLLILHLFLSETPCTVACVLLAGQMGNMASSITS